MTIPSLNEGIVEKLPSDDVLDDSLTDTFGRHCLLLLLDVDAPLITHFISIDALTDLWPII